MPRVSKYQKQPSKSSSPGLASAVKREPDQYYCTRCTRHFSKQTGNFSASYSPLYHQNNKYLPVCKHCVEEMYDHYLMVLGDERLALRRICMKFDIYWSDDIYKATLNGNSQKTLVTSYIAKSNMTQYNGKNFDDTLDEEAQAVARSTNVVAAPEEPVLDGGEVSVDPSIVNFWGAGFSPAFYADLERRWEYWAGDTDRSTMDISEGAVLRQICMLEVTISRDTASGKAVDKSVNALNNLLGSANLKPIQKKEETDASVEATPFGLWIKKIEDTRPIRDVDPEFEDVDGIRKYVSVWFLGHLCSMLKINNGYSRLYEEEMARLRVERPEYEDEDEEAIYEDIFERAGGGDPP